MEITRNTNGFKLDWLYEKKMKDCKNIIVCEKCAGYHHKRDCRAQYYTCHMCGNIGHRMFECKRAKCFFCLELGHLSGSCPSRRWWRSCHMIVWMITIFNVQYKLYKTCVVSDFCFVVKLRKSALSTWNLIDTQNGRLSLNPSVTDIYNAWCW